MFETSSWQIFRKVAPLTFLFCLIKAGLHYVGWEPWAFDSLTGTLFGAATFVIALILGSTLSDYRASESMPTAIVNALEAIHDSNLMIAAGNASYDSHPLQAGLLNVSEAIQGWLVKGNDFETVQDSLDALNPLIYPAAQTGGAAIANRMQNEQAKIRLLVEQIKSNRDTDFLGQAYVLLWVFLVGAIVALLLIGAERFSENLTVSGFMFTSFVYLVILIRDLDNPFEYSGKSSIDVDLAPFQKLCDRLGPTLR